MRLLHVVHQYPPDQLGGTELYTQELAAAQVAAGHDVHVFFRQAGSGPALRRWQEESGAHVWAACAGPATATDRFRAVFGSRALETFFRQVTQAVQPDLVHVQHLMGLPAAFRHAFDAAPTVITLHDYWWVCPNAQLLTNYDESVCNGPRAWINCGRCALARAGLGSLWPAAPLVAPVLALRQALLEPVWQAAARLITPTHFARDWYAHHGLPAERLRVVPHGIKPPDPVPTRRVQSTGQLHIGYLGGVAPQKGVHVLVEAVNGLAADQARLTVMGDLGTFPDYSQSLKAAARHPDIHFVGRLDRTRLWQTLAELDVLVVPSLWYETAALVIQEAHAVGVPVVASNLGALAERVRHAIDGLLVPPGDAVALRQTLARLQSDRDELARLAGGIPPVHTMAEHADEIETIYAECMSTS